MKRILFISATVALVAAAFLHRPAPVAAEADRNPSLDAPEAIIGLSIVHDPKALAEAIKRAKSLRDQILLLRDARSLLTGQWLLLQEMIQTQGGLKRYRLSVPPWRPTDMLPDSSGKLAPWVAAVNTGRLSSYRSAVLPAPGYGSLTKFARDRADRMRILQASVAVTDSAAVQALRVLSRVRNGGPQALEALDELQSDSLRSGSAAHRMTAVLNRIDASGVATARTLQTANQLVAARLEHDLAQAKIRRDAMAAALTEDVAFEAAADEVGRAGLTGSTRALRSFRLP